MADKASGINQRGRCDEGYEFYPSSPRANSKLSAKSIGSAKKCTGVRSEEPSGSDCLIRFNRLSLTSCD